MTIKDIIPNTLCIKPRINKYDFIHKEEQGRIIKTHYEIYEEPDSNFSLFFCEYCQTVAYGRLTHVLLLPVLLKNGVLSYLPEFVDPYCSGCVNKVVLCKKNY